MNDATAPILPCQRALFDLPDDVAYFNCAYMSPLMHRVVEAGQHGLARKARPWQIAPVDFFTESERARSLFARLIGAATDDVALVPAASYGTAVAAANLAPATGQHILVLEDQFPSNFYVWRDLAARSGARLRTIARPAEGDWTGAVLAAIDGDTALAALPNCHWSDGGLIDLERVGVALRQAGARLVLDLTQSLGAMPFDVGQVRPDFMVAATYKWLLGPYSMGFLYVAPDHHDGRPLEQNWIARAGSEDFRGLVSYTDTIQPGARRYDVGERANFALLPAVIAALEQIHDWGVPAIQRTLKETTATIATRAADLGLRTAAAEHRAGHFLGLGFPDGLPADLPDRLADANVHVSARGDSLRVTPHLYNNDNDIDRLFEVLATAVKSGSSG